MGRATLGGTALFREATSRILGGTRTAISLLGEHEFAVRLPSAVAAGFTALLVFGFARATSRCVKTGIFAAAVYLTFVEVYVVGTFNVIDNLLTLFVTATIVAFHRAVVSHDARFALLAGMAAGAAFLTKGFLGVRDPGPGADAVVAVGKALAVQPAPCVSGCVGRNRGQPTLGRPCAPARS